MDKAQTRRKIIEGQQKRISFLEGKASEALAAKLYELGEIDDRKLAKILKTIHEQYGRIAEVASREYYEQLRAVDISELYHAYGGDLSISNKYINEKIAEYKTKRERAGDDEAIRFLSMLVGNNVKIIAWKTVSSNGEADKRSKLFARVPRGATTCAFCMMLASRGFVYYTANTAGALMQYHHHCDCAIVPAFNRSPDIAGYDHQKLYDKYLRARDKAGTKKELHFDSPEDTKLILKEMRKLYEVK